jgi:hypothetical protein
MNQIAPLRQVEWQATKKLTEDQWRAEILGKRPNRRAAAKLLTERVNVTLLEWMAFAALVVLTIFTSLKVFTATVPIATTLAESLAQTTAINNWVMTLFIGSAGMTSVMLATPALIYFKVMDATDKRFINKPQLIVIGSEYNRMGRITRTIANFVNLNVISYYFPALLVYAISGYLLYVSLHGDYQNEFDKLILVIAVIAEIALAYLVSDILEKYQRRAGLVTEKLDLMIEKWETREKGMAADNEYLALLYQNIFTALLEVRRDIRDKQVRKNVRVNAWLEIETPEIREAAVKDEYRRHAVGSQNFTQFVIGGMNPPLNEKVEAIAYAVTPTGAAPVVTEELPTKRPTPTGGWTVESLALDMVRSGTFKYIQEHPHSRTPYHAISKVYENVGRGEFRTEALKRASELSR